MLQVGLLILIHACTFKALYRIMALKLPWLISSFKCLKSIIVIDNNACRIALLFVKYAGFYLDSYLNMYLFCQLQNPSLMVLPKLSFVLCSFLH